MSRPTYGSELANAANSLTAARRAFNREENPTADLDAQTAAEHQLYRSLYRQVVIITGHNHTPFATGIAIVIERTTARLAELDTGPDLKPATAVGVSLRDAADYVRTATDILATHIDPDGRPRTPEGIALLAGLHRDTNLAAVARLVLTATRINNSRQQHLRRSTSREPGQLPDSTTTATQDLPAVPADLPAIAEHVAGYNATVDTYLTAITAAVDVSGESWPPVTDHDSFIEAVDAARTWLAQHHSHDLTGQHLRTMLGAGLALTNELAYLVQRATNSRLVDEQAGYVVSQWRAAYLSSENVTTLHHAGPEAGPAALVAAESWLRSQLRHDGAWRPDVPPAHDQATASQWRRTAAELAARLPDLATMLDRGAASSTDRGDLLVLTTAQADTGIVRNAQWMPGTSDTPQLARLLLNTAELRGASALLARTAGVEPLTGAFEAHNTPGKPVTSVVALAAIAGPALSPLAAAEPSAQDHRPDARSAASTAPPLEDRSLPSRPSVQVILHNLSAKLRRSERQHWSTRRMPVAELLALRDALSDLNSQITELREQIGQDGSASGPDQLGTSDEERVSTAGSHPLERECENTQLDLE